MTGESNPVGFRIRPLDTLRLKVTDRCPWNCWWCHNEGTGVRNPSMIGDVPWNRETREVVRALKGSLLFTEVHLTGGEPTAHPCLEEVVAGLTGMGLKVKATTIGCHPKLLERLVAAGISALNFSLHSIDPSELVRTQVGRSVEWAGRQLEQELQAILLAKELGADVKLNVVIADENDFARALGVLNWAQDHEIPMRLMNELGSGYGAVSAILRLLEQLGAVEFERVFTLGSSSFAGYYALPEGYEVGFKQTRDFYLASMCTGCALRGRICSERFYGVRLERRRDGGTFGFFVRLCLHRSDNHTLLPVSGFLQSPYLREIRGLITGKGCPIREEAAVPLELGSIFAALRSFAESTYS